MFYIGVVLSWLLLVGGVGLMIYWVTKTRPWERPDEATTDHPQVGGMDASGRPIFLRPQLNPNVEPLQTEADSEARLAELYRRGELDATTYRHLVDDLHLRRGA